MGIGKFSHLEHILFIHSFDEYVLDTNYMPRCMLESLYIRSYPCVPHILGCRLTINKHNNKHKKQKVTVKMTSIQKPTWRCFIGNSCISGWPSSFPESTLPMPPAQMEWVRLSEGTGARCLTYFDVGNWTYGFRILGKCSTIEPYAFFSFTLF